MLDKTIPYKNLLMKCTKINENAMSSLPVGYTFKWYEDGDESLWADIELSIGEFDHMLKKQVEDFFRDGYFGNKEKLMERCLLVLDDNEKPVGTCTAWYDMKENQKVPSLHWIAVNPNNQSKGIGRAILTETMKIYMEKGEMPVYLHTQPWSHKAIRLYLDFGFFAMKDETFSDFTNEYNDAISVLEGYMDEKDLVKLVNTAN
jgi:GNAT superfamily N-acetyltransferase